MPAHYGQKGMNAEMAFVMKRGFGKAPFVPKKGMPDMKGIMGVVQNPETKRNFLEKKK
jgi:hypothetical protein